MFDFNSIVPKDTLKFWFIRNEVYDTWSVYDIVDVINNPKEAKQIAYFDETTSDVCKKADVNINDADVISAFEIFKTSRPEYLVGQNIPNTLLADNTATAEMINDRSYMFDAILTGAILIQEMEDVRGIKLAERCINWLRSTDFYTAPASTRFHEAEPGGLVKHTLKVLMQMYQLLTLPTFVNSMFADDDVPLHEAVLVALMHDWCKIGKYEPSTRNVKNEKTGTWEKVPCYNYKESDISFGHGIASMYIAQKFLRLNMQQALAIRWHMGRWYVADSDINDLQHSNEKYPLVHLIQFADQLAITEYAIY